MNEELKIDLGEKEESSKKIMVQFINITSKRDVMNETEKKKDPGFLNKLIVLKQKIKLLSFYAKQHVRKKFDPSGSPKNPNNNKSGNNIFSDKNDYFDSDDDVLVDSYVMFLKKEFLNDEKLLKIRSGISRSGAKNNRRHSKTFKKQNEAGKGLNNDEDTKNESYLIQKAFLKDTNLKDLKVKPT
jgi:hypothetical protein